MAEEEEAAPPQPPPSFKLFGTVIGKRDREVKQQPEEEEAEEEEDEVAHPAIGAAAAAAAKGEALPCPRCKSRETKFCYFNNYNVNQPRHFCKACHRYWTAGGALRNVPVGAGRRRGRPIHRPTSAATDTAAVPGCVGPAVQSWILRPGVPPRFDLGIGGGAALR